MDYIENGRPAYHPSDLLKLFIYGYMNKVRSTRDLDFVELVIPINRDSPVAGDSTKLRARNSKKNNIPIDYKVTNSQVC